MTALPRYRSPGRYRAPARRSRCSRRVHPCPCTGRYRLGRHRGLARRCGQPVAAPLLMHPSREAVNVALWSRRANGVDHHRLRAPDPDLFCTGWIDSVRFTSLITVIDLALGSLSACSQPESRSKQMATRDSATPLGSPDHDFCRDHPSSRASALHCAWLVGWNLTPFG
jgi:hypothetical protein